VRVRGSSRACVGSIAYFAHGRRSLSSTVGPIVLNIENLLDWMFGWCDCKIELTGDGALGVRVDPSGSTESSPRWQGGATG